MPRLRTIYEELWPTTAYDQIGGDLRDTAYLAGNILDAFFRSQHPTLLGRELSRWRQRHFVTPAAAADIGGVACRVRLLRNVKAEQFHEDLLIAEAPATNSRGVFAVAMIQDGYVAHLLRRCSDPTLSEFNIDQANLDFDRAVVALQDQTESQTGQAVASIVPPAWD